MNETFSEKVLEAKNILDSSEEPNHERAYFAGQQWVSEEVHQKELATALQNQREELVEDISKNVAIDVAKHCIAISEMTDEQIEHLEETYGFNLSESNHE